VTVGGVWLDGNFNGRVVDMPVAMFRRLYGTAEPPDTVRVSPAAGTSLSQLRATLVGARLDPDLTIETPAQVVTRASNSVSHQLDAFSALQRGLLAVAFIAVLSTLLLVGVQRRREIGLLAAIGMEPRQLGRLIAVEAIGVAIMGAVLATAGGILLDLAFYFNIPLIVGYQDPLGFSFTSLALWAPVSAIIVLAAAALPAWRTSRIQILDALQYE
jgi:putative ABC transport system permease protein